MSYFNVPNSSYILPFQSLKSILITKPPNSDGSFVCCGSFRGHIRGSIPRRGGVVADPRPTHPRPASFPGPLPAHFRHRHRLLQRDQRVVVVLVFFHEDYLETIAYVWILLINLKLNSMNNFHFPVDTLC